MSPKEFSFKKEELRPFQILLNRFTQDNWFNDDYCRWYVKKLLKTRLIVNYGSYETKTNARYVVALKPHARASKSNQVKAHILIWELYHRKCLPKNFVVVPLNGNFLDLNINNLKAIPRQERLSELCSGKNNYFYVNGITLTEKLKSKKKFWSYKAKQFKKNKVCKICASNKNLVVHHLVNYRLFKDPNEAHEDWNLVVVCSSCHSKIHWGDKDLTGLIEETQLCKSIELLETLEKEGKDISLIENSFKTISSEALQKFKERSTTSREAYTVSV